MHVCGLRVILWSQGPHHTLILYRRSTFCINESLWAEGWGLQSGCDAMKNLSTIHEIILGDWYRRYNLLMHYLEISATSSFCLYELGRATGYWLDGRDSIPARTRDFSLLHSIQNGSWAYPASYPMGTESCIPGVRRQEREDNHTPHLVPRSIMLELYLHSPMRLHDVVLN
jgi:hypothetical protein